MKNISIVLLACAAVVIFAGCGSSADPLPSDGTPADGRVISGTIETDAAALTLKEVAAAGSCIGQICAVEAQNSSGEKVTGEIDPAMHRWRLRLRSGNWMFGFLDGSGQRLGFLEMNGIPAVTIEDGDDIDLGPMQLRNGVMVMNGDVEGLGVRGIYSYRGSFGDRDRDGIPTEFDDDEDAADFDASVFDVLMLRPYDGQPFVAPCRPIKVLFTQPIDDASVTADTLIVTLDDGTPIVGTLAVWEDAEYLWYEVKFTPTDGYPMGAIVHVTVVSGPNGILSETGEALAEDVALSFTVRDFGETSVVCHDPDGELLQLRLEERERIQEGQPEGSGN